VKARLLAAALWLAPALAFAGAEAPERLTQHVTDRTGTLSAAQIAELEAPLVALEQRKGAQVAILVVASTGEQSLEDYSLAVAEGNKLGRAKPDDGLLLLVAKDDRKARIEVGYGLEGAVTDALSSRIIREYLAPHFRQGDYFGGLKEAEAALVKLVDGEPLPPTVEAAQDEGSGPPPLLFAVFLGLFVGLFAGGTRLKPVTLRRLGAALAAGGIGWLVFSVGLSVVIAAIVAFLVSGSAGGRFGSGRGGWGSFPGGGGGWGGGGLGGGGGGWSGGGGSFGGGGASGGW
jgi:uncharacterized protein